MFDDKYGIFYFWRSKYLHLLNSSVQFSTADTIEYEASEESRLFPNFSLYRSFNSQKLSIFRFRFNTKMSLEKLHNIALTSLDLPWEKLLRIWPKAGDFPHSQ